MPFTLPLPSTLLFHVGFIFACLLLYAVSTHVNAQRRHPSAAMAWVITIVLIPYVALPLYLLVGNRKIARPPRRHKPPKDTRDSALGSPGDWAIDTIEGMGLGAPVGNTEVRFHEDGSEAWQELARVICAAEHRLDICIYVFGHKEAARRISQLLQERAAAGVRVRLLLDTFGSWSASRPMLRQLRAGGVGVRWFMPLIDKPQPGRLNMRNHRKIVVADGTLLWSGGRNIAIEYFFGNDDAPAWLDLSFTVEGPLAKAAQQLFAEHWRHGRAPLVALLLPRRTRRLAMAAARASAATRAEADAAVANAGPGNALAAVANGTVADASAKRAAAPGGAENAYLPGSDGAARRAGGATPTPGREASSTTGLAHVTQLVPSGPDQAEDTVYALLLTAMFRARDRVLAVTPYFVPDDALLKAMRLAAQRGVRVELIVPLRSNHWLADISRNRALHDLAAAGAHVRLMPRMVHAKAVVIDDTVALAGSVNLDSRSLFLSFEMMIAFYSPGDIDTVTHWIQRNFAEAEPYRLRQRSLAREIGEGLVRWLGFQI
ncbi:MAG: phospholipase D-like domain-containing protein [Burkholderiales bacterium]